jgi:hypothetical protein
MGRTIILVGRDFYSDYWANIGHFEKEGLGHVQDCADILLDLGSEDGRPELKDLGFCQALIPRELRKEINAQFGSIPWANHFHDSIATTDDTTSRFPKPCKDITEAMLETAKVYNGTNRIIILSNNTTLAAQAAAINNVGVIGFKDFASAFKKD